MSSQVQPTDDNDQLGFAASESSVTFEVTLSDSYLETVHDPVAWLGVAKTCAALVIAQTLVDELEQSEERHGEPLTSSQRNAIFASSTLLGQELEIVQVRDGSIIAIIVGTIAVIIHWQVTIEPVISAVSTGISVVKLAKRLVDRLHKQPSQVRDLDWIKTLPKGSVVVVKERDRTIIVTCGA